VYDQLRSVHILIEGNTYCVEYAPDLRESSIRYVHYTAVWKVLGTIIGDVHDTIEDRGDLGSPTIRYSYGVEVRLLCYAVGFGSDYPGNTRAMTVFINHCNV
jgi:hypothetical protein